MTTRGRTGLCLVHRQLPSMGRPCDSGLLLLVLAWPGSICPAVNVSWPEHLSKEDFTAMPRASPSCTGTTGTQAPTNLWVWCTLHHYLSDGFSMMEQLLTFGSSNIVEVVEGLLVMAGDAAYT
uniref:Uncharacterized protein n=1 Tax=Eutreptiella gymnastica TaxID=73025 RepID=A0A7S4FRJ9_9EUGL